MNIINEPKQTLRRIGELKPGTAYEADGAYWLITVMSNYDTSQVLVVNLRDGRCVWQSAVATVVPLYCGFAPIKGDDDATR